jgi:alkaline phosphatase D
MTTTAFEHAVASFEPTTSGVLLWTRLSGHAGEVEWIVASDPDLRLPVAAGYATTGPDRDHTVVVDVDGLVPATTYWYRFMAGEERSPVGRTRTLPAHDVGRFRMAAVSCACYSVAPLGVYRAVSEREVDLVLHLGDYIYENEGDKGPRRHEPPRVATSLDDYRRRLAQIRRDPDAQAMHLRHPMIAIWDDHDIADNAWRGGAKKHDPEQHGPWADRVANAARARQEWLPARLRHPDDPLTVWRSVTIGDLAELLLLDTRFTGRDEQAGDDESADLDDPARSLLGDEQRAWLRARLADVDRPWALVASGVVINEIELSWPRPFRWINHFLPNGYAILDGRVLHDDQWDGYPAERSRLTSWMADRGRAGGRTVILSGDVHSSWAFAGPIDDHDQPVAMEMTTPAVSSAAMGRAHYPGVWRVLDREVNRLPHVGWADVTERGYGILDLTPVAATATWWFVHPYAIDPAGDTVPSAGFRCAFDAWPPRLEPIEVEADDPERPGLAEPAPPRPDDLGRIRWRRRLRLAGKAAAAVLAIAASLITVARTTRR